MEVTNASGLEGFKSRLEMFKSLTKSLDICKSGNLWKLSDEVLNRIESGNY